MISADLSMKELGPSEARVLAAFLPKCTYVVLYTCLYPLSIAQSDIPDTLSDNRALTSLNISDNRIGQRPMAGKDPNYDRNWETDVTGR